LLENETVGTFHLIGSLDQIIETRPAASTPIICSKVSDSQFSRRIRREQAVHPDIREKMMSIFIQPYGIRGDGFLKIRSVFVIEGRHHRLNGVCKWACSLSLGGEDVRPLCRQGKNV